MTMSVYVCACMCVHVSVAHLAASSCASIRVFATLCCQKVTVPYLSHITACVNVVSWGSVMKSLKMVLKYILIF